MDFLVFSYIFSVFFSYFLLCFATESSFLIVLISNCAPFLLFFASEAPDQAPRELTDGTGRTELAVIY